MVQSPWPCTEACIPRLQGGRARRLVVRGMCAVHQSCSGRIQAGEGGRGVGPLLAWLGASPLAHLTSSSDASSGLHRECGRRRHRQCGQQHFAHRGLRGPPVHTTLCPHRLLCPKGKSCCRKRQLLSGHQFVNGICNKNHHHPHVPSSFIMVTSLIIRMCHHHSHVQSSSLPSGPCKEGS